MNVSTLARHAPSDPPSELAAIRAELDAVDTQILDLISRRLRIGDRVRAVKPAGVTPFRPAREAEMLARLGAGPVPAPLVQSIWRALIGATLAREGLTEVVVQDAALLPAARARFGGQIAVRVGDARLAADDPHLLGVVPAIDAALPAGVRALAPLDDEDGRAVGWIVGRENHA